LRQASCLLFQFLPNIATVYGLEDSGGTHFLIMSLQEVLKIAVQIAQGLEMRTRRALFTGI